MIEKITLIIVDFQRDFYHPNGSLFVGKDTHKQEKNIVELMESGVVDNVIFTADNHPFNHCSFKPFGGLWPPHCIKDYIGSSINPALIEACNKLGIKYQIIKKGENKNLEEYGAFKHITDKRAYYLVETETDTCIILKNPRKIVICGIAGDYCVLETAKNLKPLYPEFFMDGIISIDDGTKLNKYIKNNKCKIYGRN